MSLIFSAFVPHSPILLPTLGEEHLPKAEQTLKALAQLEEELYAAKPDTLIVVSGHGEKISKTFSINHTPTLTATFKNFGDLKTSLSFTNNLGLAYKIKEKLETTIPIQLTTPENLNYGVAIPLFYLTKHLPNVKIIPLQTTDLPLTDHWELGKKIRHELDLLTERVAIIATGNLAHATSTTVTPNPDHSLADQFNRNFLSYFENQQTKNLLTITDKDVEQFEVCGLRPAVFLAGILDGIDYQTKILSYEMPLGIGWATLTLQLV